MARTTVSGFRPFIFCVPLSSRTLLPTMADDPAPASLKDDSDPPSDEDAPRGAKKKRRRQERKRRTAAEKVRKSAKGPHERLR